MPADAQPNRVPSKLVTNDISCSTAFLSNAHTTVAILGHRRGSCWRTGSFLSGLALVKFPYRPRLPGDAN